jgi:hypothetical protein
LRCRIYHQICFLRNHNLFLLYISVSSKFTYKDKYIFNFEFELTLKTSSHQIINIRIELNFWKLTVLFNSGRIELSWVEFNSHHFDVYSSLKSNKDFQYDVFLSCATVWDARHCRKLRLRSTITSSLSFCWFKSNWSSRLCNAERASRRYSCDLRNVLSATNCAFWLRNSNESSWWTSLFCLTCLTKRWVCTF